MNRKKLGKLGEEIAIKYLLKNGYKVIDRNFRTRFGEIDIICEKDNSIIFVEVRTTGNQEMILPEESVTKKKIENYKKLAIEYLLNSKKSYKGIKFEFIGINYKKEGEYKINHIYNFID